MDGYALTRVLDWSWYSCLCASSLNFFFRNWQWPPATGKEAYDIGSFFLCAYIKKSFQVNLITSFLISSLVGIYEGMRPAVHSNAMACIEAEQEGSSALSGILCDLFLS